MKSKNNNNAIPPLLVKAKRKDNGEWIYGDLITGRTSDGFYRMIRPISFSMSLGIEVIPETLCWHFGKTDMNGEELFTGDLIKVPDTDVVAEIFWDEENSNILYRNPDTKGLMIIFTSELEQNFIKVGNIHDETLES